jgi:hypothetical protein
LAHPIRSIIKLYQLIQKSFSPVTLL